MFVPVCHFGVSLLRRSRGLCPDRLRCGSERTRHHPMATLQVEELDFLEHYQAQDDTVDGLSRKPKTLHDALPQPLHC